ncbi:DgyrCDS7167 [Dimorphilus gyrociliatus]|uniref:DgyrCDS7167 n=1 Tax=Dimorphilus gyrociliatus TaxID=2664684 RepID=A0A7I8VS01_9ANNE|nr:DgyrCDS7167 [Dimorphilus gyrociliatus]
MPTILTKKEEHEKFISNLTGTSITEIAFVQFYPILLFLLKELIVAFLLKDAFINTGLKFILDFFVLIIPMLVASTIGSNFLYELYIITTLIIVGFLLVIPQLEKAGRKKISIKEEINKFFQDTFANEIPGITHFRSYANIGTAILILAIDFSVCPRRFAKTENFGTGLMDIGVGSFVFANGIVSPQATGKSGVDNSFWRNIKKNLISSLPLIGLGFGRLYSLKATDYHEHVTEYGIHWNFFFTLAIVKVDLL